MNDLVFSILEIAYDKKSCYQREKEYAVYQYDVQGNLMKKWDSFKELCDHYNRKRCYFYFKGNYKCFKDFILMKDPINAKQTCSRCNGSYTTQKKKVCQYDLNGNLIKIWNCGRDAERFLNVNRGNISQAISGDIKTLKDFIWKRL